MKKILIFFLFAGFVLNTVLAEPFKILGPRATGMGGASVALAGDSKSNADSLTQYWNPAALALYKKRDAAITVDLGIEVTGDLLHHAETISEAANVYDQIQAAQQTGSYITLSQIEAFSKAIDAVNALNASDAGLVLNLGAGLNTAIGKWAISVNNFTSLGIDPNIDLTGLDLGGGLGGSVNLSAIPGIAGLIGVPATSGLTNASNTLAATVSTLAAAGGVSLGGYTSSQISNAVVNYASSEGMSESEIIAAVNSIAGVQPLLNQILTDASGDFLDNTSNIVVKGLSLSELAFGHGLNLSFLHPSLEDVFIGANFKYLYGVVGYIKQDLWSEGVVTSEDIYSDFRKNIKESSNFGIDIGLLLDFKDEFKTRIGLVAKNINEPGFDQPDAAISDGLSDHEFDSQVRIGVAVWPLSWVSLAVDYDLTENSTSIDGYDSQYLGGGVEFNLINKEAFNLALRCGIMDNLGADDSSLTYTAGLGISFAHFIFELSAAASADEVKIEDGNEIPTSAYVSFQMGFNF